MPFLRHKLTAILTTTAAILFPLAAVAQTVDDCPLERAIRATVQSSPFPSLPGQTVSIGIFVEPVMNIVEPTGTVQLLDGLTDIGTFPLKQAQVSLNRIFNDAGAHVLNAIYSGDFNYCGKTVTYGQAVDRITSTVTLTSSAPTAPFGTAIILTAQIGPPVPTGVAAPTGPVQFFDGTASLGSVTPVAGKATLTVANLAAGSHQITAALTGDFNWFAARSAPLAQTVSRTATATLLTANAGLTQTTLTAVVTPAATGGTVQFIDAVNSTVFGVATLLGGSATATISVPAAQISVATGHPITALYSGDTNFSPSSSNPIGIPAPINAAGAASPNFAPDELVSLFGLNLANASVQAPGVPLPTSLGGDTVTVTDTAGVARPAALYLVSPDQINFVIPAATAPGAATVTVTNVNPIASAAAVVPIRITIASVAPGLFSAVQILRVRADGSQAVETVSTAPIQLGADPVYLILYGTGVRNRSSLANVTATIGGRNVPAAYAGPQPDFPGLDQLDVLVPPTLNGAGKVPVTITADGQVSNVIMLTFQ